MVGAGYWSANIMRIIANSADCELLWVVDVDENRLRAVQKIHPSVQVSRDFDFVLNDPDGVDLVYIATPPSTHKPLVEQALVAGKHVLVEKPMTDKVHDAISLYDLASRQQRTLMVGHTFMYDPALKVVKELLNSGQIGNVRSILCQRINEGGYQEAGVVWDLLPHDLSILAYLFDEERPNEVFGVGESSSVDWHAGASNDPTQLRTLDGASLTFKYDAREKFPRGLFVSINLAWLAPDRMREIKVIGTHGEIIYNPDKGQYAVEYRPAKAEKTKPGTRAAGLMQSKPTADISFKRYDDSRQPLDLLWENFAFSCRNEVRPLSHQGIGLDTVIATEAAIQSIVLEEKVVIPTVEQIREISSINARAEARARGASVGF